MSWMRHPDTDDPSWLFGHLVDEPEVRHYLAVLDDSESASGDGFTFWTSASAGLSLEVACTRRICHVALFAGRGDGNRYGRVLPFGLDLDLVREDVVATLGEPELAGPSHDTWRIGDARFGVLYDPAGLIRRLSVFE